MEHDFVVAVEIIQVQLPVEEEQEMVVQVHSLQGTSRTPHIAVL